MNSLIEGRKSLHQQISDYQNRIRALEEQLCDQQPLANLGMAWAMTAHELNNLFMPLLNYSNLALQHPDDADLTRKALKKACHMSEQAARVLDKVLTLAKPGTVKKEVHPVCDLIENVFTCIARDFAKDKIKVIFRVKPTLTLWGDSSAIQQVLLNLILNARHAMEDRGGTLTITATEQDESMRIEITDTGSGIDPERLKTVFTPFYTTGKENGNGLGLAFCRKVIESHDGCISVDSQKGEGTCFRIVLPKKGQ